MQSKEIHPDRLCLRRTTAFLAEGIDMNDPSQWWRTTARRIITIERKICQFSSPSIREDMLARISELKTVLRNSEAFTPTSVDRETQHEEIASYTEHVLLDVSMRLAERYEPKELAITYHRISLAELVQQFPDRMRISESILDGVVVIILSVKHPTDNLWFDIPLPKDERIWHKGGPARAVLNILAGAPISMQKAEFPWNDLDVITAGDDAHNYDAATKIGVDPDGVEYMGEAELNFPRFAFGRDTDQNQCCLGSDGLYYSDAALKAAQTGHISIVGQYIANKAIYGVDSLYIEGIALVKARGLMRLIKNVVEGKALSFDYKPVNNNFDVGIYVLFLAKKWSKRKNRGILLQNLFYLLQKMGQSLPGEQNIMQVLDRAHRTYPFFDFDREINTKIDLTKWKVKKFAKQFDRESAWEYAFPALFELERKPLDDQPVTISLGNFKPSAEEADTIKDQLDTFIEECRVRTANLSDMSMYERLFMKDDGTEMDEASIIDDD